MAKRGQIPLENPREEKEKEPKEMLIGLIDIYNEWQLDADKTIKSCKKYGKKGKEKKGQKEKEKYGQKERRFLQFVAHSLEMKWDGNSFSAGGQKQEEDDDEPSVLTQFLCFFLAPLCILLIVFFLHIACTQMRHHHQQQQRHENNVEMLPAAGAAAAPEVNLGQNIHIGVILQQLQHRQQPQGGQQQQEPQALLAAYHAMPQILFMAIDQQSNECAICLDQIDLETFVRPLPCNHIFHNDCIENWYGSNHETCPLCRREMATQNVPEQHNNGTANGPN
ncbi:hypothetical protein niasHT_010073 [Heterodera trifolii]|uniref:RING-type domain-containing protein n=1 Tax=Heterodera trifolii TaxID=157864 RepID=A0ABD2M1B6_9BILA